MSGSVIAGIVAAFFLGIIVSAAIVKRFARHFPANENIGKTVLQMTRHSGFNDFIAGAFLVGFTLCAIVGGALWYSFPRTVTVTEQVPVDRIVTKEVIKEVPVVHEVVREVPAPAAVQSQPPNSTSTQPSTPPVQLHSARNCGVNWYWDSATASCVYKDPTGNCPDGSRYEGTGPQVGCHEIPTPASAENCPSNSVWVHAMNACAPCAPGLHVAHSQSGARCVE